MGYTKETHAWERSREAVHELHGLIFKYSKGYDPEGKVDDVLEYVSLETSLGEKELAQLLNGVLSGASEDAWEQSVFYYSLVRHGEPWKGQGGYYPLPLIFATPEERRRAEAESGKPAPPERWVRRKRNRIVEFMKLHGFEPVIQ